MKLIKKYIGKIKIKKLILLKCTYILILYNKKSQNDEKMIDKTINQNYN